MYCNVPPSRDALLYLESRGRRRRSASLRARPTERTSMMHQVVCALLLPGVTFFTAPRHHCRLPAAARRSSGISMLDDGSDLASQFAKEAARRQQEQKTSPPPQDGAEPFSGIKEVILDSDGTPRAIPRRPAPPPASTQADEVKGLVQSPFFIFGSLLSVASLALLLLIAQADANASM